MNGKLARALRRSKTNTLALVDEPRIVRYYGRIGRLESECQPKFPKARVHKRRESKVRIWPVSKDQKSQGRPLIVMSPKRHIEARIKVGFTSISNLTYGVITRMDFIGMLPKHAIDYIALGGWL